MNRRGFLAGCATAMLSRLFPVPVPEAQVADDPLAYFESMPAGLVEMVFYGTDEVVHKLRIATPLPEVKWRKL